MQLHGLFLASLKPIKAKKPLEKKVTKITHFCKKTNASLGDDISTHYWGVRIAGRLPDYAVPDIIKNQV